MLLLALNLGMPEFVIISHKLIVIGSQGMTRWLEREV